MKTPEQQKGCPYCGTLVKDLICDKPPIMSKQIFENREWLVSAYVKASAAELVEKAELKAWISARDLQDFKDYQDEARNSSFSISTFKTLNDDVQITISIVEAEVGK